MWLSAPRRENGGARDRAGGRRPARAPGCTPSGRSRATTDSVLYVRWPAATRSYRTNDELGGIGAAWKVRQPAAGPEAEAPTFWLFEASHVREVHPLNQASHGHEEVVQVPQGSALRR